MANTPQARKRARQAEIHRQRNAGQRSKMRTYVKRVSNALQEGDAQAASAAYKEAVPKIDGAVSSGLIHKNKAARDKSRLNAHVKALATS